MMTTRYLYRGLITVKMDAFALGVVIGELLTNRTAAAVRELADDSAEEVARRLAAAAAAAAGAAATRGGGGSSMGGMGGGSMGMGMAGGELGTMTAAAAAGGTTGGRPGSIELTDSREMARLPPNGSYGGMAAQQQQQTQTQQTHNPEDLIGETLLRARYRLAGVSVPTPPGAPPAPPNALGGEWERSGRLGRLAAVAQRLLVNAPRRRAKVAEVADELVLIAEHGQRSSAAASSSSSSSSGRGGEAGARKSGRMR